MQRKIGTDIQEERNAGGWEVGERKRGKERERWTNRNRETNRETEIESNRDEDTGTGEERDRRYTNCIFHDSTR